MNARVKELITRLNGRLTDCDELRRDFRTVLDLLLPGRDYEVLPVGETGWPHSGDLREEILHRMVEGLHPERTCQAWQRHFFGPEDVLVEVIAEHLLDDYWLIRTQHAGINEEGRIEVVIRPPMARAIVRITSSSHHLPYTSDGSPRVSPQS